jgi:transposase
MIDKDLEAKILRHHFVEQWGVNTIARQMGIHHTTVDRVLAQAGLPKAERARRPSIVDPYHPLILETLAQYPTLTAARLLAMARARGYAGGASQFRAHVAQLRPRRPAEAYLRLKTLPGEQAQVDWGHFGHLQIGRARWPLMAFVMVLSFSRQIFLRFYLDQRMDNFLRGHVAAFEAMGGVARVLLYDNLRSAVLERRGSAIRFHPTLLDLSAHYRFEPRPVAPARGNEKGRVERAIRYIRGNFFAGRSWAGLDDLNAQAAAWCDGPSAQRPCPEDPTRTVAEAFAQEQTHLIALPDNPYPTEERLVVHVGKTPYVRFEGSPARPAGDRRNRLPVLRHPPCRPAVRDHQPPLRAQTHPHHHQPPLRRVE